MPPEFSQLTILYSCTTNKNSAGMTTTALYALFSAPTTLEACSGQGDILLFWEISY
ncbi:hypothetical protein HETIRDRAFT_331983 [Heterobasidion irregulare TC 32-1]|uniref:Uncharacterized protein n=1 Tax=Heterobasidion irregulare (strain TC 32-1) TaxID=747525 RepID=W4JMA9_HETIT|nr:uncharacterized protein HETIRDRAFT_331983 [Heterobasidion irregulare TC 32-1]ETW74599.1 hypothetical protein HETIRDRAFT_331983 [Heterobasidion irregulare TC 32-1]